MEHGVADSMLVSRQKGPPEESSSLPKAAYICKVYNLIIIYLLIDMDI